MSFTYKTELWKYWQGCLLNPCIRLRHCKNDKEINRGVGREGQDGDEYISTRCGFMGEWSLLPISLEVGQWKDNCSMILERKVEATANHLQKGMRSFKRKMQWSWIKGWGKSMTDLVEILSKRRPLGNGHCDPNEQKSYPTSLLNNNSNSYPILNTPMWKIILVTAPVLLWVSFLGILHLLSHLFLRSLWSRYYYQYFREENWRQEKSRRLGQGSPGYR